MLLGQDKKNVYDSELKGASMQSKKDHIGCYSMIITNTYTVKFLVRTEVSKRINTIALLQVHRHGYRAKTPLTDYCECFMTL